MTELFDKVIQELKSGVFNNTYIQREFKKKYDILDKSYCRIKPNKKSYNEILGGSGFNGKYHHRLHTCFGNVYLDYFTHEIAGKGDFQACIFEKCGVEVLGMKPNLTADGKYSYDGHLSIKELKDRCKQNGLKGYSNKDKAGIIQLLMKV